MAARKYEFNPGSEEAIKRGCQCPEEDNRTEEALAGNFWITNTCPLHGHFVSHCVPPEGQND